MFVGCGYTSKGRDDYNNHLQKHEDDKEVGCDLCHYSLGINYILKYHMKTLQVQGGVSALHRPLTDMLTSEVIFKIVKIVLFVRKDLQEFKI